MYEITVTSSFVATHAIRLHDGSREPVHEHEWHVRVTVGSQGLDPIDTVMDFHVLEQWVQAVVAPAQGRDLGEVGPFVGGRVNPTAERVAGWIGTEIAIRLPPGVSLVSVSVEEAPGCWATFQP